MRVLDFATTIKDASCANKVSTYLDVVNGIYNWEVDTTNEKKILTVRGRDISSANVLKAVKKAGFQANLIGEKMAKARN